MMLKSEILFTYWMLLLTGLPSNSHNLQPGMLALPGVTMNSQLFQNPGEQPEILNHGESSPGIHPQKKHYCLTEIMKIATPIPEVQCINHLEMDFLLC